jgi:hypothetical protein
LGFGPSALDFEFGHKVAQALGLSTQLLSACGHLFGGSRIGFGGVRYASNSHFDFLGAGGLSFGGSGNLSNTLGCIFDGFYNFGKRFTNLLR